MCKHKILIVEDDAALAEGVRLNLELSGFHARIVNTVKEARVQLDEGYPDLLLLDINLPDGDGTLFAAEIKKKGNLPFIFLTARDLDEDMIAGFMTGADDYITKPFHVLVLVQRVKAVLRRYEKLQEQSRVVEVGNLSIDFEGYTVMKNGEPLSLTPTEFKLLEKFCANPGIVLTRGTLLEALWDKDGNFVDEHTLTIFVSRLRQKIADEEFSYIRTVYGTGYTWMGDVHG